MKTLSLIAFGLMSLIANAHSAETIECERQFESSKLHYRFDFSTPKSVKAIISLNQQEVSPPARSVIYSKGRMVGIFNELSHDEELFLITQDLLQTDKRIEKRVEVLYRDGSMLHARCWNKL